MRSILFWTLPALACSAASVCSLPPRPLPGVPVIEAPSEAEAQCAQLNKEGLVRWTPEGLTFPFPARLGLAHSLGCRVRA